YIDYVNGSDSNNGTSTSTPWQHCPGDANASGNAASYAPAPGDEFIFKGGVVYYGQIGVNWSGASGSPIVYDGNSAGTFGTGKAIIDGGNSNQYGFVASQSGVSYITINNFEIRNIATTSGLGISFYDYNSGHYFNNIKITNNYVHNVGYWENDGSTYPGGVCIIVGASQTGVDIENNEVTKCGGSGVAIEAVSNSVVANNNIHDYITWGIDVTGNDDAAPTANNDIRGNQIHDIYQYDTGFYGTTGEPHTDFIMMKQGPSTAPVPDGNIIEQNLFYNDYSFANYGGTAMIFLDGGGGGSTNTVIRNNVMINPHSYYTIETGGPETQIYNNTVYAPRASSLIIYNDSGLAVKNNILIGGCYMFEDTNMGSISSIDYNLCESGGSTVASETGGTSWTFPQWQSMGYDTHGIFESSISSIGFTDTSEYPTACESMDLKPSAGSPATGAGANLSASFEADVVGIKRPPVMKWTVGGRQAPFAH
ncbi:MAG: right-handed parallel beta-helix repeat-containing protein, partial [Nitrospiraceae bacterium]|nr:right-handed parallel beta-helix repeat-containing protein [Nitrospiraceae bacterium]